MIYEDKILVKQRRPIAKFQANNYFPISGETITLINQSIESEQNIWTINDGINIYTGNTVDVNIKIQNTKELEQSLNIYNGVSGSTLTKYIYTTQTPTRIYSNIQVNKECARNGDNIIISAIDINEISGSTQTYEFILYKQNESTPYQTFYNKTNSYIFTEVGIYDIKLIITTESTSVVQYVKKIITITPSIGVVEDSILLNLEPSSTLNPKNEFGDSGIIPGSIITLKISDLDPEDSTYRIQFNNLSGTTENPIIITTDSETQFIFYFDSYFGINFYNCNNIILDGKGFNNLEYGIHITKRDTTEVATAALSIGYLSTDIHIFGIEISKPTFCGLFAKTDPNINDPATWRVNYTLNNLILHHNYFHDTNGEGNYIGYYNAETKTGINSNGDYVTYRAHEIGTPKIYRNIYMRTGWDSLQINNATRSGEICYNTIENASIYPEANQSSFMSMTIDGDVYNNTLINSGGVGIQFGTFTGINLFNNLIIDPAIGAPALLILSSLKVPEQNPNENGINTGSTINIYNNSIISTGAILNAQNVIQWHSVYFKNNLVKYSTYLLGGQSTDTISIWESNASNNFELLDDGLEFKIADIYNNNFNISPLSILSKSGTEFGNNYDIRGFENWYTGVKHIGAYSSYKKLEITNITLLTFLINSGQSQTNNTEVEITFTTSDTITQYMISESPSFSSAIWENILLTNTYILSDTEGLKTLYLKVISLDGYVSNVLNSSITLSTNRTFLIDLGPSNNTYLTIDDGWNNLSLLGVGTTLNPVIVISGTSTYNLIDIYSILSNYSISVSKEFNNSVSSGAMSTTGETLYVYSAYRDQFLVDVDNYSEITISNLNINNLYTIKCYASKAYNSNRTIYTINNISIPLLTLNNYNNTADFVNIKPDINNEIKIKIEGTNSVIYNDKTGIIGVIEILENMYAITGITTTTTTTTTLTPTTTTTTTIINESKKILIDLGPNVNMYYTPSDSGVSWNNLSGGINTDVLSGLTVNNLSYSDFSISYYYIKTLTIFKSKSNAIIETDHLYPYTAYRDSFNAIISGETESCAGEIEIGNLNSDYTYTIKCYGCREYVNNNTIYTINEISIELLTKSNYDNTADFIDIQPDINNKIIIKYESDIEYSDKIAYLNVLEIIENKNVI